MKSSLLRKRPCLKAGCLELERMTLEQLTMKAPVVSHKVPPRMQAPKFPSGKPAHHPNANVTLSRAGVLAKTLPKSEIISTPIAQNKPETKPVASLFGPTRGKISAPILHPSKPNTKKPGAEYFDKLHNEMQPYSLDMEYYPYKYT